MYRSYINNVRIIYIYIYKKTCADNIKNKCMDNILKTNSYHTSNDHYWAGNVHQSAEKLRSEVEITSQHWT